VFLIQQSGIGADKYFLPAQSIAHDQNHVSSLELCPGGWGRQGKRQNADNKKSQFTLQSSSALKAVAQSKLHYSRLGQRLSKVSQSRPIEQVKPLLELISKTCQNI
jgi:hypothetical protein